MDKKINWLVSFLLILLPFGSSFGALFAESLPFWKSKPQVYKKIQEERAIIVSAKSEKLEKNDGTGKRKMTLITAGRIRAPLDFTFKTTTNYDQYKKILPFVDEAAYDKETKKLFASGSFLGLRAKMTLLLSEELKPSTGVIKWEIVSGFLTGMRGVITEEKISDVITEISLDSTYIGSVDLPAFLMNWGFEFVGQKMASAMRSYVESQWEIESL